MVSVGLDPNGAGGEPAAVSCMALTLEVGEPDPLTVASPCTRIAPALQCVRQRVEPRRVRLFAVLRPPRCRRRLDSVPVATERRERPRNVDRLTRCAHVQPFLDERKAPVVREAGRTAVRSQRPRLTWGRVERESICLDDQRSIGRSVCHIEHTFPSKERMVKGSRAGCGKLAESSGGKRETQGLERR